MRSINHLKRKDLPSQLRLQSDLLFQVRTYLHNSGFTEVSTPLLSFPTKEYGDGEFLVISKLQPKKLYALPHSPQLYKQFLMGAFHSSISKYFQIAWNFRPEFGDATHGQEFRQIDFEIAGADIKSIQSTIEDIISIAFSLITITPTYQTMTYDAALQRYGSDSPDFRYIGSPFQHDGPNTIWEIPQSDVRDGNTLRKILKKFPAITFSKYKRTIQLLVSDYDIAVLGKFRNAVIAEKAIKHSVPWAFLWLSDLPLFKVCENGTLQSFHHPQMAPALAEEFWSAIKSKNIEKVLALRGLGRELIVNGMEVAGGNVRNDDLRIQKRILRLIDSQGHAISNHHSPLLMLLKHFPDYSSGGAAIGFDRLILLLTQNNTLRDAQAFPLDLDGKEFFGGPFPITAQDAYQVGIESEHALLENSRQMVGSLVQNNHDLLLMEKLIAELIDDSLLPDQQFAIRIAAQWRALFCRTNISPKEISFYFLKWAKSVHLCSKYRSSIQHLISAKSFKQNSSQKMNALVCDAETLCTINRLVDLSHRTHIPAALFKSGSFIGKLIAGFDGSFHTPQGQKAYDYNFKNRFSPHALFHEDKRPQRTIIALGGSETIKGVYQWIDKALLSSFQKKYINIYYLPIAMFQRVKSKQNIASYARKVGKYFSNIDKRARFSWANQDDSVSTIQQSISNADIIYLSGGDTSYLIQRLKDGLSDALAEAYQRGAMLIGNSAGILALCDKVLSFDSGLPPRELCGIGLIKRYSVVVHWNEKYWKYVHNLSAYHKEIEFVPMHEEDVIVFADEQPLYMQKKPL